MSPNIALLVLLAAALPAAGQETVPVVGRHLDLELAIDYETETIRGVARWTVENPGDSAVSSVPLQIGRLMTAEDVRIDGEAAAYAQDVVRYEDWDRRQVTQLVARAAAPIEPGGRRTVSVRYTGALVPATETGMLYVRDHIDRAFTILRAESFAFPVLAVPSLSANRRAPRADFTYRLRLAIPADLVAATGVPAGERTPDDSLTEWTFESRAPVPFLNVAIAPYRVLAAGGLAVYHFPEDSAGAANVLGAMRDALGLYADWFGPLGSDAALHVIEIPEGWGSQASLVGGIIQTADAFRETSQLTQLYHELAHLWHPDDLDRPAPRWNEGLATFLQHRVAAERDDPGSLDSRLERLAASQLARYDREPELADVPLAELGRADATGMSYGTGALFFYALYRTLGPDAFDEALGGWFRRYRHTGSSTAQFADWLRGRGGPGVEILLDDWMFSTRWLDRMRAGASLDELVSEYRAAG